MSLAKSYSLVGSATLASRLTGFVRDILIAAVLGSSAVADAYLAAFLLPNLFRRVLSEGAFNAAFVPIYARRKAEEGEASIADFMENALSSLVALVLVALLAAELAMPLIVGALAPGFSVQPEKLATAVTFSRIAFGFVAALIVVALMSSILNAMGRYALVAIAPLILNFMMIPVLAVLLLLGWRGEYKAGLVLVVTVLAAGIAQLLYVAYGLVRAGVPLRFRLPRRDSDVRRLLVLMLPGLMIAGAGHFNMVVAAQTSSELPAAVSWLYYADRIFQLPLSFVAAAIGTVLLPEVARAIRNGAPGEAVTAGNRALEFGMLLVLPAAIALTILAFPIIDIIYRRGAFTLADSLHTADILRAIALGLPGFVLVKVFLPPYLAREQYKLPLVAALTGVAANVALTIWLLPRLGHQAAPLGVALSGWVNAVILGLGLKAHNVALDATARRNLPRIVCAAAITGAVTYALYHFSSGMLAPENAYLLRVLTLAFICIAGVLVHIGAVQALGAADVRGVGRLLRKRT